MSSRDSSKSWEEEDKDGNGGNVNAGSPVDTPAFSNNMLADLLK